MKKAGIMLAGVAAAIMMLNTSCGNDGTVQDATNSKKENSKTSESENHNTENIDIMSLLTSQSIYFPPHTHFDSTATQMTFEVPEGWTYIYNDQTYLGLEAGSQGSITCNCTAWEEGQSGGGCHPQLHRPSGALSCVLTHPCNDCERSAVEIDEVELLDVTSGGFVLLSGDVKPLDPSENIPVGFKALLDYDDIKSEINSFIDNIYGEDEYAEPFVEQDGSLTAPQNHKFMFINAFGRAFALLIPEKKITIAFGAEDAFTTAHINCDCLSEGSCSAVYDGPLALCSSFECSSCRLTTTLEDEADVSNTILLELKKYSH